MFVGPFETKMLQIEPMEGGIVQPGRWTISMNKILRQMYKLKLKMIMITQDTSKY